MDFRRPLQKYPTVMLQHYVNRCRLKACLKLNSQKTWWSAARTRHLKRSKKIHRVIRIRRLNFLQFNSATRWLESSHQLISNDRSPSLVWFSQVICVLCPSLALISAWAILHSKTVRLCTRQIHQNQTTTVAWFACFATPIAIFSICPYSAMARRQTLSQRRRATCSPWVDQLGTHSRQMMKTRLTRPTQTAFLRLSFPCPLI